MCITNTLDMLVLLVLLDAYVPAGLVTTLMSVAKSAEGFVRLPALCVGM